MKRSQVKSAMFNNLSHLSPQDLLFRTLFEKTFREILYARIKPKDNRFHTKKTSFNFNG